MTTGYTLKELSDLLSAPFKGSSNHAIFGIADLQMAGPNDLSFVAKKQFEKWLVHSDAGAVIVAPGTEVPDGMNVIEMDNPYLGYARASALFSDRPRMAEGIHPSAVVDESAVLAPGVRVGPHCVIQADVVIGEGTELFPGAVIGQGSRLGRDCLIYSNAVIYHGVSMGERVIVHANAIIGVDGFGLAPTGDGWEKIHQLGGVTIGNDVEIGASSTVARGALRDTILHDGVKLDCQVHVAHNCELGRNTALAGGVGVAGSTKIGKDCMIGGNVGIGGHLEIADKVQLNGASNVTGSIKNSGHYSSGVPLQEVRSWRRNAVRFGQLDEWVERIKQLERASEE